MGAPMHQQSGDIHHIVPKDYLQKNGYPDRGDYNQVANFVLTETSINISISNRPPSTYMPRRNADLSLMRSVAPAAMAESTSSLLTSSQRQTRVVPLAKRGAGTR